MTGQPDTCDTPPVTSVTTGRGPWKRLALARLPTGPTTNTHSHD